MLSKPITVWTMICGTFMLMTIVSTVDSIVHYLLCRVGRFCWNKSVSCSANCRMDWMFSVLCCEQRIHFFTKGSGDRSILEALHHGICVKGYFMDESKSYHLVMYLMSVCRPTKNAFRWLPSAQNMSLYQCRSTAI